MAVKTNKEKTLDQRFLEFHRKNPAVYERFIRHAFELRAAGRTKGSAGAIFERMRWDDMVSGTGEEASLNNNYRSRYARLVMKHPHLVDFFVVRILQIGRASC